MDHDGDDPEEDEGHVDDKDDDVGGDDNGRQIFLPSPGLLVKWSRSQEENVWNPFLSHATTTSTWHCNHNEDDDDDEEDDGDNDDQDIWGKPTPHPTPKQISFEVYQYSFSCIFGSLGSLICLLSINMLQHFFDYL